MRDFAAEIQNARFWDSEVERAFTESGIPRFDFIMQIREEIIALAQWMEEHNIKSYLEIGVWTGGLLTLLNRLFNFKTIAACDLGLAQHLQLPFNLPKGTNFFHGNSQSPIFENWRRKLGPIDLIFIDSTHQKQDIAADFEINRKFPHRFIALQGIAGGQRSGEGVKTFWQELSGSKTEILCPHSEIGSEISTMGIGIWSAQ